MPPRPFSRAKRDLCFCKKQEANEDKLYTFLVYKYLFSQKIFMIQNHCEKPVLLWINIYLHLWGKSLFCVIFGSKCRCDITFLFWFASCSIADIFDWENYQNYLLPQFTFVCFWNFCHSFGSKCRQKKRFSFAFASANMNEKMISLRVKLKKQMKKSLIFCLSFYVFFWN